MILTKQDYIDIREMMRERDQLNERLTVLESSITSAKAQSLTRMSHQPPDTSDRINKAIGEMESLWDKLIAQKGKIATLQAEREDVIAVLPTQQRVIMRYRYCEGMHWDEIALKMNYAPRHVFRIHKESLAELRSLGESVTLN